MTETAAYEAPTCARSAPRYRARAISPDLYWPLALGLFAGGPVSMWVGYQQGDTLRALTVFPASMAVSAAISWLHREGKDAAAITVLALAMLASYIAWGSM